MKYVIIVFICFLLGCKSDTTVILDRIGSVPKSDDCCQCIKILSEKTPARMSGCKMRVTIIV